MSISATADPRKSSVRRRVKFSLTIALAKCMDKVIDAAANPQGGDLDGAVLAYRYTARELLAEDEAFQREWDALERELEEHPDVRDAEHVAIRLEQFGAIQGALWRAGVHWDPGIPRARMEAALEARYTQRAASWEDDKRDQRRAREALRYMREMGLNGQSREDQEAAEEDAAEA